MHELAATESLLRVALRAAEEDGASRINRIVVGIGHYSGILSEYVEKYFPIASEGTIASEASLEFHVFPVRAVCSSCGRETELDAGEAERISSGSEPFRCNGCGGSGFRLLPENWDIRVERIEVD